MKYVPRHTNYTTVRPLRREPIYVKQTRDLVRLTGSVPSAVAEKFRQANLHVSVEGDISSLSISGASVLLVGDHRMGLEFAPLLAVLGEHERDDAHWLAKPFSHNARIMHSLESTSQMVVPVLPGTLARDRPNIFNSDLGWRLLEWHRLPGHENLNRLNLASIEHAARLLDDGHIVTLYPTGRIADAGSAPWRRGVGRILKQVIESKRDTTNVVLFRFDDFSSLRVARSLLLHSHGLRTRPYTITLRTESIGTVGELLREANASNDIDTAQITAQLRQHYLAAFRGTAFREL